MGIQGEYVSLMDIDIDLFGEPQQSTISYLRERVERHAPKMRDVFNGFFEDTREMFERYNGDNALRRIRQRVRRSASALSRDVIRPLRTLRDLQTASPIMQRYVMANPMARRAAERQEIDGYSDSYRNPYPGRSGFNDPDFMRVIDGIVFDEDRYGVETDKTENAWVAYQDVNGDDTGDDRSLDVIEQGDALSTWDVLEAILARKKKDFSSILNENM